MLIGAMANVWLLWNANARYIYAEVNDDQGSG